MANDTINNFVTTAAGQHKWPNIGDHAINGSTTTAGTVGMLFEYTTAVTIALLTHQNGTAIGDDDAAGASNASRTAAQYEDRGYVFDQLHVKIVFGIFYGTVFFGCVFGNALVIIVVIFSRRLRSITNFFLANLAAADFFVGIFCVLQNFSLYLIDSWVFGEVLCRMYQYVQTLSYIASIFILILICVERYCAIIHPITCKQFMTKCTLRFVVGMVWTAAAFCAAPKFLYSRTITNTHSDGKEETICIMHRALFNSKNLDMISLWTLYVVPLMVMSGLYSRIAITLWKSSLGFERNVPLHRTVSTATTATHRDVDGITSAGTGGLHVANGSVSGTLRNGSGASGAATGTGGLSVGNHHLIRSCSKYEKRTVAITESQVSVDSDKVVVTTTWRPQRQCKTHQFGKQNQSGSNVLRARRGVIRMLIIFVATFAIFNFPLHARKMYQNWSNSYSGGSDFSALLTPLTFLAAYFNSALNPLLYAFLSRNFRMGMGEVFNGMLQRVRSQQSASLQQRLNNQQLHHTNLHHHHHHANHHQHLNHSLPTDITHVGMPL